MILTWWSSLWVCCILDWNLSPLLKLTKQGRCFCQKEKDLRNSHQPKYYVLQNLVMHLSAHHKSNYPMSQLFKALVGNLSMEHFPSSGQHSLMLWKIVGRCSWNQTENPAKHFVAKIVATRIKLTNMWNNFNILVFPINLNSKKKMYCFLTIFFLLGFTPCKAEQPLQGMGLQEKEVQKD